MQRLPLSAMAVYGSFVASLFSASSAVPTPIYRFYQQTMSLSSVHITTIFAIYVVTLLLALLVAGRLSDHLGRKPVLAAALALNLIAMLMFTQAQTFEGLLLARLMQGLGVGIALPTSGAAIIDASPRLGPTLNAVTPFLGLTVGAMGASLAVSYAPMPLVTPYLGAAGLSLLALVLLPLLPETGLRRAGAMRSLRPRVAIPARARGMLARTMPITAGGWAIGGLYMSLMPGLVAEATGIHHPLLGGGVIAVLMSMASVSSVAGRLRPARQALSLGGASLMLGVLTSLAGIVTGNPAVLFGGTALAGLGQGFVFSSTLRLVLPMAEERDRAGLLAAFFVLSYMAFAVPTVLAGWAVPHLGVTATVAIYGAGVVALAGISMVAMRFPLLTPRQPLV